jgi:hypothetical protein
MFKPCELDSCEIVGENSYRMPGGSWDINWIIDPFSGSSKLVPEMGYSPLTWPRRGTILTKPSFERSKVYVNN